VSTALFGFVVKDLLILLGYAPVTFPGITEAVEAGNYTLAEEWVKKTAAAIRVAGNIIKT
jgi:N-acetylated-alpha-linked acidic dipeptidase